MNFLIDESVSLGLVHALREANNTVLAIAEIAQRGISDNEVWSLTKQQSDGILITRDYHFTNPSRFNPQDVGAIIFIRPGNLTSREEISLVLTFVRRYPLDVYRGKLVTLSRQSVKIR